MALVFVKERSWREEGRKGGREGGRDLERKGWEEGVMERWGEREMEGKKERGGEREGRRVLLVAAAQLLAWLAGKSAAPLAAIAST